MSNTELLELLEISPAERQDLSNVEINSAIVNFIITWQLAKRRAGTHATKTMSTVHGTNRKPHRQKGGGVARQGSKKGPHMIGGAVSMGPQPRDYEHKANKKVRKLALKMIIADKCNNDSLILVKSFPNSDAKTQSIYEAIRSININDNALFIFNDEHDQFVKGLRNVKNIDLLHVAGLNAYSMLRRKTLVVTQDVWSDICRRLEIGDRS